MVSHWNQPALSLALVLAAACGGAAAEEPMPRDLQTNPGTVLARTVNLPAQPDLPTAQKNQVPVLDLSGADQEAQDWTVSFFSDKAFACHVVVFATWYTNGILSTAIFDANPWSQSWSFVGAALKLGAAYIQAPGSPNASVNFSAQLGRGSLSKGSPLQLTTDLYTVGSAGSPGIFFPPPFATKVQFYRTPFASPLN